MRRKVGQVLGLLPIEVESHHSASPWKYAIVRAVQVQAKDPDEPLSGWLQHGAPMGLSEPIAPSGLFPPQDASPDLSLDDLAALPTVKANHPSFLNFTARRLLQGIRFYSLR